jgi:MFS family permease
MPIAAAELGGMSLYGVALGLGYVVMAGVFATDMWHIVLGVFARGLAAGLIAGLGMGALGDLYEREMRTRVLGMFALMWLLPSILGPFLNGAIVSATSWRIAFLWPALLVIVGRLFVVRYLDIVRWSPQEGITLRSAFVTVPMLVILVVVQALSTSQDLPVGLLLVGLCFAVGWMARRTTLRFLRSTDTSKVPYQSALVNMTVAYFGAVAILPIWAITFLGGSVWTSSILVGAATFTWAVIGASPIHRRLKVATAALSALGLMFISFGSLAALGIAGNREEWYATVLSIAASCCIGLAMGVLYPRLLSEPFELTGEEASHATGVSLTFSESAGSAAGIALAAMLMSGLGWMALSWVVLAVFGAAACVQVVRVSRRAETVHVVD